MGMVLHLCGLLKKPYSHPKKHTPSLIMNIRQIPVEGYSTKYLSSTPQNCHCLRRQNNYTKMCCTAWDPRTEKGHKAKTNEI